MASSSFFKFLGPIGGTFNNLNWQVVYEGAKATFIMLDAILAVGLIFVLFKAWHYRPKFLFAPYKRRKTAFDSQRFREKWAVVIRRAESNPPSSYSLAIIEADKFTDDVLKRLGMQGEHMADRLEHLNNENLKTLDKLWRVHRIRNEIVHSPDFSITSVDTKEILAIYEEFLKELGVL